MILTPDIIRQYLVEYNSYPNMISEFLKSDMFDLACLLQIRLNLICLTLALLNCEDQVRLYNLATQTQNLNDDLALNDIIRINYGPDDKPTNYECRGVVFNDLIDPIMNTYFVLDNLQ